MIEYRLLGGLTVTHDGQPVELGGAKRRIVLASLLIDLGRAVSPQALIDHLWGDDPPPSAETSLQAYVSNLRRLVEPGRKPREEAQILVTRAAGYALLVPRAEVDTATFEDLAAAGHAAVGQGDSAAAVQVLDRALALWTGPPLPELAGEPWVEVFATGLAQVHAQAREDRFDAGLALGDHAALVAPLEAAVAAEPFRERLRAQLALALFRSGRQREALQALQTAREVLLDEAGIDPGPELRQLEADILNQAASLAAPAPPTTRTSTVARTARPFVGREHELDVLLDAASAAARGEGRPVLISGEPGLGKTRLVEELTARVPDMWVAWGRCPESAGQAAYWPCIQLAQQIEAETDRDDITPLMAGERAEGSDRFAHHLALARLLADSGRPQVLVIDDLQWADPASLRVLELMVGELRSASTLLVMTMRPMAPDAPPTLVDCVAEVARQPGAVRLDLGGLSSHDVEEWLHDRAAPGVAALVHDRTGGNAFFVQEVIALLGSEGQLLDTDAVARSRRVPVAVQDVIRRRVARLPVDAQQLLTMATAVGRAFDVDVLAAVAGVSTLDALDRLEASLQAGIVDETDLPGRFAFSHALVADTLAAEVNAVRRARLHAAIAEALVRLRAADLDGHVAEIANHAFEGAAAGSADLAVEWTVRSARAAFARLAFEDAIDEWERALHALSLARPSDRAARLEILYELARSHLANDAIDDAFSVVAQAVPLAIEVGDLDRLGEVSALTNIEGLWFAGEIGLSTVNIVPVLQRALEVLPDEVSTTRALILGGLAESGYWGVASDDLDRITREAVAVARAAGDRDVVVRSLMKRSQAMWRPAMLAEREAASDEMLALLEEGGLRPASEAHVLYATAAVAWEHCDADRAAVLAARARELARDARSVALTTQLDLFTAAIHIWYGRFDQADATVDEFYELYRRTRRWSGDAFRAAFKALTAFERGDIDAVRSTWDIIQESVFRTSYIELYAFLLAELGLLDEAAELVEGRAPELTDSWVHLGVLGGAAHARALIGDKQTAAPLLEPLRRYTGRVVAMGTGPGLGDISFALARVERLFGHEKAARRAIDDSITLLRRSGRHPWLARALLFRADLMGSEQDELDAREIIDDLNLVSLRAQVDLK